MPPRVRAALIHLGICAAIAAMVFLPIYLYWYPGGLFGYAGGRELFTLIVGVDVTLGPLITLIIFKPGKKSLKLDLTTIAVLQLVALAYGVWVLFESRPAYIAFVRDRFELVRANSFPEGILEKSPPQYADLPLTGPRLVGVKLPTDPNEARELLMSALGGVDAQYYPRLYVPYEDVRAEAKKAALPLSDLRAADAQASRAIDRALASLGRREADVRFLPLTAGKFNLSVLVDAGTGDVLGYVGVDPWQRIKPDYPRKTAPARQSVTS